MNKFNYLQLVGTTIIVLPMIIITTMIFVYNLNQYQSKESITTEVAVVIPQPKVDSVGLVSIETKKVVLKPTPPKLIVRDTLSKLIVVKLDSVKPHLDTTLKIN